MNTIGSTSSLRKFLVSLPLLPTVLHAHGAGDRSRRVPRSVNSSYLNFGPGASSYVVGKLPDVNFNLPASWAGQIPVANTSNDELFFWLFGAETQPLSDNFISKESYRTRLPNTDIRASMAERRSWLFLARRIDQGER